MMEGDGEAHGHHHSGATGNTATVRVFANLVGSDVVFTHDWKANGGKAQDPPIEFKNKSGSWDMDFEFHDATGLGLEFLADAHDAMWVRQGSGCPNGKGNGGQITFGGNPSSSKLSVTDDNQNAACDLHFMLRFTDGNDTYEYDPIIKNGGSS